VPDVEDLGGGGGERHDVVPNMDRLFIVTGGHVDGNRPFRVCLLRIGVPALKHRSATDNNISFFVKDVAKDVNMRTAFPLPRLL
jgi:hypothetical protein